MMTQAINMETEQRGLAKVQFQENWDFVKECLDKYYTQKMIYNELVQEEKISCTYIWFTRLVSLHFKDVKECSNQPIAKTTLPPKKPKEPKQELTPEQKISLQKKIETMDRGKGKPSVPHKHVNSPK